MICGNMEIRAIFVLMVLLGSVPGKAAIFDINQRAYITCLTDEKTSLVKIGEYEGDNAADKLRASFFKWVFGREKLNPHEQIDLIWTPKTSKGSKVSIITKDGTNHNLITVRTKSKDTALIVTSASGPYNAEGWLFALNFNLKTMVASRLDSHVASITGEVMTYECLFEDITGVEKNGVSTAIDIVPH